MGEEIREQRNNTKNGVYCWNIRKTNEEEEDFMNVYGIWTIPANSHALGVSLTPAGWKLRSRRLTPAGQFLTPDWKMWVVAVLLDTISKKYVNSDPCKEGKPFVKWINDNTFLAISDFWSEKHWERARVYTRPNDWDSITSPSADFERLRKSSDFFGNLRESSEIIVSSSKIPALPE